MRKSAKIIALLLVMMFALSLVGCSGGQGGGGEKKSEDKIILGYIGPMTGDMAIYGEVESQSLKMEIENVNSKGGILGKQIELKIYDNRGDAVETTNAARKAIQNDKVVAFVGCNTSSASLTLANVCDENKIPMIATTATNSKVTQEDDGTVRPYVFRMCLSDPQLSQIMAKYAYNEMNVKKCDILYEVSSDYSVGVSKNFTEAFEKLGGQITTTQAYKTGDVDFRAQLSKIKDVGNFDAIFAPALYKELGLVANQARALGINQTFIGPDCWMMEDLFTIAKDSMQGSTFICAMNVNDPKLTDFKNAYKAKYGSDPGQSGTNGYFAYDAFMVLKNAIEKAGVVDSTKIRDEIENTADVQGLTCPISIDKTTHNPVRDATIFHIDNGKFVAGVNYK